MRTPLVLLLLTLAAVSPAAAQRRFRIGPTGSVLGLQDLSGNSHTFNAFGGSVALVTGDDGENGLTVARYDDLSTDGRARRLSLFALDSYYYPVGTRGVAPFASTELGLARVTESAQVCPLLCQDTISTSSQIALAFGLGVRINAGSDVAALIEGRFLQVPGSDIQAVEARANLSVAFGSPRQGEFTAGRLGPPPSHLFPRSGPPAARPPPTLVRVQPLHKNERTHGRRLEGV